MSNNLVFRRPCSLRFRLAQTQAEKATQNDAEPPSIAFSHHIEAGFQLATAHGPLCAEPMEGMAFFVEVLDIDAEGLQKETCVALLRLSVIPADRNTCLKLKVMAGKWLAR